MPTKTLSIQATPLRDHLERFATSDTGVLIHAAIFSCSEESKPGDCWASLYILRGGTAIEHRSVALCSGYVGGQSGPSWSGRLSLEPDDRLCLHIQASSVDIFRGVFTIEQD